MLISSLLEPALKSPSSPRGSSTTLRCASPSSTTTSPASRFGAATTPRSPDRPPPNPPAITPKSPAVTVSTGFDLAAMIPLKLRIPRLHHTRRHRHHRRQRTRHLIKPGLRLTIHAQHPVDPPRHVLANVTDGNPNISAICSGTVPVYPSDDSVAANTKSAPPNRCTAAANTFAVVNASEPANSGSDTNTPPAAPIARRRAHPRHLTIRRHRHQTHLTPTRRIHQLQPHLHPIRIRLIQNQLALTPQHIRTRHQHTRQRRIRNLLHTHDHIHRRHKLPAGQLADQSARRVWPPGSQASCWYRHECLRILLVVNSFASSVTARNTVVVHRRFAEGNEVEMVETNRRGHATRFAHDAARRGVDVVIGYGGDGTLNEVATGIAGTDTALGVLPGGSTNVFARTLGMPNDPVRRCRPAGSRYRRRRPAADRPGAGQRSLLLLPHRHRLRRRRRQCGGEHASLKRWLGHPLFISAAITTWLRGYDRHQPHFRLDAGDRHVIDDGYFSIVLNTNPYTYLGNRPLDLSPAATSTTRSSW